MIDAEDDLVTGRSFTALLEKALEEREGINKATSGTGTAMGLLDASNSEILLVFAVCK